MNTATRLGGFALGLVAVFAVTYGAGQIAGPGGATTPAAEAGHDAAGGHDSAGAHGGDGPEGSSGGHPPGGLQVSDRGYSLVPVNSPAGEFAFRINGVDGRPITAYDVEHDKRMHLIAARRDLSGFRHVHPELDPDGTWRVPTPLSAPGSWRLFADFKPTGAEALTLGVDVAVGGAFTPVPLPAPASSTTVDGYTVTIGGTLRPGATSPLTLTVSRDGEPVTDLQPYLGAYGHLVMLRQGDLAYLHVHPEGSPGDGRTAPGPEVRFAAEVPSTGTYRLYLDFQHAGVVRTAEFTMVAGQPAVGPESMAPTAGPGPAGTPVAPTPDDHGTPGHPHT
ncbi:hypothetical protein [Plantactinospora sp. GCM10030261]|uniref:hypothetical protein n=1 Tax=Plantactinospora sp. GCM10030261 TaxID=3273420 RepID=UPI0036062599